MRDHIISLHLMLSISLKLRLQNFSLELALNSHEQHDLDDHCLIISEGINCLDQLDLNGMSTAICVARTRLSGTHLASPYC